MQRRTQRNAEAGLDAQFSGSGQLLVECTRKNRRRSIQSATFVVAIGRPFGIGYINAVAGGILPRRALAIGFDAHLDTDLDVIACAFRHHLGAIGNMDCIKTPQKTRTGARAPTSALNAVMVFAVQADFFDTDQIIKQCVKSNGTCSCPWHDGIITIIYFLAT
jgi:hypothetical protein